MPPRESFVLPHTNHCVLSLNQDGVLCEMKAFLLNLSLALTRACRTDQNTKNLG